MVVKNASQESILDPQNTVATMSKMKSRTQVKNAFSTRILDPTCFFATRHCARVNFFRLPRATRAQHRNATPPQVQRLFTNSLVCTCREIPWQPRAWGAHNRPQTTWQIVAVQLVSAKNPHNIGRDLSIKRSVLEIVVVQLVTVKNPHNIGRDLSANFDPCSCTWRAKSACFRRLGK